MRAKFALSCTIGSLLCASTAFAVPLITGAPAQSPVAGEPDPVGGTLVASLAAPFASGNFSGTLLSQVYVNDLSSPFGPTGLTFTYQITNAAVSTNHLERLTVNDFTGFLTDGSYQVPLGGGDITPIALNRPTADVVGFTFLQLFGYSDIGPGQHSAVLVIQTNSPTFNPTFASIIDGTTASAPTFAPIPEPVSLCLLAVGSLMLVRRGRR